MAVMKVVGMLPDPSVVIDGPVAEVLRGDPGMIAVGEVFDEVTEPSGTLES